MDTDQLRALYLERSSTEGFGSSGDVISREIDLLEGADRSAPGWQERYEKLREMLEGKVALGDYLGGLPLFRDETRMPFSASPLSEVPALAGSSEVFSSATMRSSLRGGMTLGRYELTEWLDRGAMGEVWLAYDPTRETQVIIKVLPPELLGHEVETERVRATFRRVSKLQHSHICPVYDLQHHDECGWFLVMKKIEGVTLDKFAGRRLKNDQPMSEAEVDIVLRPIAEALDYAHREGVVHRDVKPQNIMVAEDGSGAQLIDFGLAAQVQSSLIRTSQTSQGETAGSPAYMAPEQWRGMSLDGKADQYALAVVAHELLVGVPPFDAPDYTALRECALREPPRKVQSLSDSANGALIRALSKKPEQRFGTCVEFFDAFNATPGSLLAWAPQNIKLPRRIDLKSLPMAAKVAAAVVLVVGGLFALKTMLTPSVPQTVAEAVEAMESALDDKSVDSTVDAFRNGFSAESQESLNMLSQRESARWYRDTARKQNAKEHAPQLWKEAEQAFAMGENSRKEKDWETASDHYNDSMRLFGEANSQAAEVERRKPYLAAQQDPRSVAAKQAYDKVRAQVNPIAVKENPYGPVRNAENSAERALEQTSVDEVVRLYQEATQTIQGQLVALHLEPIEDVLEEGRTGDAKSLAESALAHDPDNVRARSVLADLGAEDAPRLWTATNNQFSIKARLVSTLGTRVTLRDEQGVLRAVDYSLLTPADQRHVKQWSDRQLRANRAHVVADRQDLIRQILDADSKPQVLWYIHLPSLERLDSAPFKQFAQAHPGVLSRALVLLKMDGVSARSRPYDEGTGLEWAARRAQALFGDSVSEVVLCDRDDMRSLFGYDHFGATMLDSEGNAAEWITYESRLLLNPFGKVTDQSRASKIAEILTVRAGELKSTGWKIAPKALKNKLTRSGIYGPVGKATSVPGAVWDVGFFSDQGASQPDGWPYDGGKLNFRYVYNFPNWYTLRPRTIEGIAVRPASDSPRNYRKLHGKELYFEVFADSNSGSVYGSGPYTYGSSLRSAAVHAGALRSGERGIVKVTMTPGRSGYTGSDRNGVESRNSSDSDTSYQVEAVEWKPEMLDRVTAAPAEDKKPEQKSDSGVATSARVTETPRDFKRMPSSNTWGVVRENAELKSADGKLTLSRVDRGDHLLLLGEAGANYQAVLNRNGNRLEGWINASLVDVQTSTEVAQNEGS